MNLIEREKQLFTQYPLGHEFEYMGITMRVYRHQECLPPHRGFDGRATKIYCNYVDKAGVLRTRNFTPAELGIF